MSKREMTDSLERPGFFKEVKVVLVGPAKCGKTALIQRFVNDIFSDSYVPTGFEKYSTKNKIGDYTIDYSIWDTSGSGSYDTVRPLAYQDANVFILCFNVAEPESFDLAINKWLPEIRSHSTASAPIILCGCKADIRHSNTVDTTLYMNQSSMVDNKASNDSHDITYDQAYITCQHIGASGYVETCSKYPNTAVHEVFQMAAEAVVGIPVLHKSSSKHCSTKKRKIYSVSTNKTKVTNPSTNVKPHIKLEIRKSTKNCTIM